MTTFNDVFGGDTLAPSEYKYATFTLSANATFYWPYNSTGTPYIVAKAMDFNLSSPYSISMPSCKVVSPGESTLIRNLGSATLTVLDATGGTIGTVAAGVTKYFYVTSNLTDAGTWANFTFGTGTSSADAASLAGYGLTAIGSTLNIAHPVVTTAANYTVTTANRGDTIVFTGGLANCTLPNAATAGNGFNFSIKNNGSGTITIVKQGTDTLDQTSVAPGESLFLNCSGSGWYTVGYGRSSNFAFTQLNKNVTGYSGTTLTLSLTDIQNKIINFYGTLTDNTTVLVPGVAGVYFMSSDVATYNITVKTATGVGITLSPGASNVVVCDGVDVSVAVSSTYTSNLQLPSGTLTAPSLSFQAATNTGFYNPTTGTVGIVAGGLERLRINGASGVYQLTMRDALDIGYDPVTGLVSGTGGLRVAGSYNIFSYDGSYNDIQLIPGTTMNIVMFESTKNSKIQGTGGSLNFEVGGLINIIHAATSARSIQVEGAGQVSCQRGVIDQSYTVETPLTGQTKTANSYQSFMVIAPAGTIATLTVVFPASPVDGQEFGLSFTQTVTTLTLSAPGTTIKNTLTTATGNTWARWKYNTATLTWYRMV